MGRNRIRVADGAPEKPAPSVPEVSGSVGTDSPDLARRRLVKGAAAAAPVILTLRSGSALAQVSALNATPWSPGLEPSTVLPDVDPGQCAGYPEGDPTLPFKATYTPDAQWAHNPVKCPDTAPQGFDTNLDGKLDACCPTNTVLVTASSATSLSGTNTF